MRYLVKIEDNHDVKIVNNIYDYLSPKYVYVPILEKREFKVNDYIYKNTYFEDSIVSVSGKIAGSQEIYYQNKCVPALKIENDFKENIEIKRRKKKINNKEELISLLEKYHLNSIINKLSKNAIETLVISSIDEEIYSLIEFMRLQNNYSEILETVSELIQILNLDNALIVTKNTNSKSIQNVKSIIGTYPNIKIGLVPDKYMIGYSKFLCEFLNKEENSTLILTANEVYDIYNVLFKSKDKSEKLITISGDAILKSLVINTKIGVSLEELLEKFITFTFDDFDVYINGFLKGIEVKEIKDIVITDEIDSIVINKKGISEISKCINCGACVKVCPVKINVKKCYVKKLSHKNCLGCGLCDFICPANLKLKEVVWRDDNEK